MKNLCEVEISQECRIVEVKIETMAIKRRLLELGFLPGKTVKVARKSLTKKTVLVEIGGYLLALRCSVAQNIFVE